MATPFLNRYVQKRVASSREINVLGKENNVKQTSISSIIGHVRSSSSRTSMIGSTGRSTSAMAGNPSTPSQLPPIRNPAGPPVSMAKEDFLNNVEFCKNMINFADQTNINTTRPKKTSFMTKLLSAMSNQTFVRSLDQEQLDELFNMIKLNVIRFVPPPPVSIVYADAREQITTHGWQHLSLAHNILYQLVINGDKGYLQKKLTRDFIIQYSLLLESQDAIEQNTVEMVLTTIFDQVPGFRQIVLNSMLKLLTKYRDFPFYYSGVGPALRFLNHFFRNISPIKPQYISLFRTLIFPLIATSFAADFAQHLSNVAAFFSERDSETAEWSVTFLLKHWPRTDSEKVSAFVVYLIQLSRFLSQAAIGRLVNSVFSRLNECLLSPNYKVALTALGALANSQFIYCFAAYSDTLMPLVFHGVNACAQHWHHDVVRCAGETVRSLFALNAAAARRLAGEKVVPQQLAGVASATTWAKVARAAADAGEDINVEKFDMEIESTFYHH